MSSIEDAEVDMAFGPMPMVALFPQESNPTDDTVSEDLKPDDILIAVMGMTGSGKSAFISKLLGKDVGIGHGLESCTSEIGLYSFLYDDARHVWLLDTPGFDDTNRSDTEILKDIAFYLSKTYSKHVKLTGIIYLHRITDNRLSGSGLGNLKMFKALCGEDSDVYRHIVLATTMWEPGLATEKGEARQNLLIDNTEWWGLMYKRGSQVYGYKDTQDSAMKIVSYLVNLGTKTVVNIQKEMIEEKKTLLDTSAGKEIGSDIQKGKHMVEDHMARLQAEKEEALAAKDQELADELTKAHEAANRRLQEATRARDNLAVNFKRLEFEQQAKYKQKLEEEQKRCQTMEDRLKALEKRPPYLEYAVNWVGPMLAYWVAQKGWAGANAQAGTAVVQAGVTAAAGYIFRQR